MDGLEVLARGGAAQIVVVIPHAPIAGAPALALADVSEGVLDTNPFAQPLAPDWCRDLFAQALLDILVCGDLHGAACSCSGVGADGARGDTARRPRAQRSRWCRARI